MVNPTTKRIRAKIRGLENYLNGMQMIPSTHCYRNAVTLALSSKALTVSKSICALVDAGFPAEAFAMSRTLIDIFFSVRYISNKDTEARARTFVKYQARVRVEWREIIRKYFPKTPHSLFLDAGVLEEAKRYPKAHWTGHGGQAKLMALEEDTLEVDEEGRPFQSAFDYDAIYFWTSHYVHATIAGVEAHAPVPGTIFRTHSRKQEDEECGPNALFNVVIFLLKIFIHACRAMKEEQPPILQKLHGLVAEF
jgi:hypothetical protein